MFRMLTACILVFVATPAYTLDEKLLREGDIIFQETSSDQALAVGEELARVMTSAASLGVPLEVEIKRGESLAEV